VTLIDLGDPGRPAPEPIPLARAGRDLLRRRRRALIVAGLLAATALTQIAAGSTRAGAAPRLMAAVPSGSEVTLSGDRVFTVAVDDMQLTASSLETGQVLWRLTPGRPLAFLRDEKSVLLVILKRVMWISNDRQEAIPGRVLALDPETGRLLWERIGDVPVGTRDARLVIVVDGQRLRGLDPRDGRIVWDRSAPIEAFPAYGEHPRLLAAEMRVQGGELAMVDLDTGSLTAAGRLDPQIYPLFAAGDPPVVAVLINQPERSIFTTGFAVRPQSASRAWSSVVAAEQVSIRDADPRCGPWVCSMSGRDVVALDPRTGGVVWRQPGRWDGLRTMHTAEGRSLLLLAATAVRGRGYVLVDPQGGQVVADLGDWTVLGVLAGRLLAVYESARPGEASWLGVIGKKGVRPLVALGSARGCITDGRWLFCAGDGSGPAAVWRTADLAVAG
jgi:outer membrane protein assembly factor BamB